MALKDITKLIQKQTQAKTVSEQFIAEYEKSVYTENAKEHREPSKSFKPSSIGGCDRNIFYQLVGQESTPDFPQANFIGICESGTDRHLRIQTDISKMPNTIWLDIEQHLKVRDYLGTSIIEKFDMETKCYNENLNMRFLCDGLIQFHDRKYIVEVKTEAAMKFQKRDAPEPKHIMQATCYALCLGVDEIIFIYENRNLCNKKVYHVEITEEQKNIVIEQVRRVQEAVTHNVLPPKSDNKSDCTYCIYKGACKGE